jgi:hypothetical protein
VRGCQLLRLQVRRRQAGQALQDQAATAKLSGASLWAAGGSSAQRPIQQQCAAAHPAAVCGGASGSRQSRGAHQEAGHKHPD